jgi:4a-hydroxytetrahydrobiopterin dehydratase
MELKEKRCVPCEGGIPKLSEAEAAALLPQLSGWAMKAEKLEKQLRFKDFAQLMAFVHRVADLAEEEGHHPDFCVHYNRLDLSVWTHAVDGLTENDFVLAAKIDALS